MFCLLIFFDVIIVSWNSKVIANAQDTQDFYDDTSPGCIAFLIDKTYSTYNQINEIARMIQMIYASNDHFTCFIITEFGAINNSCTTSNSTQTPSYSFTNSTLSRSIRSVSSVSPSSCTSSESHFVTTQTWQTSKNLEEFKSYVLQMSLQSSTSCTEPGITAIDTTINALNNATNANLRHYLIVVTDTSPNETTSTVTDIRENSRVSINFVLLDGSCDKNLSLYNDIAEATGGFVSTSLTDASSWSEVDSSYSLCYNITINDEVDQLIVKIKSTSSSINVTKPDQTTETFLLSNYYLSTNFSNPQIGSWVFCAETSSEKISLAYEIIMNELCTTKCVNGNCSMNTCECFEGWNGTYCENALCTSCINGECIGNNVCKCYDGWNGTSCDEQTPICRSCVNGECVDNDVCRCYDRWNGTSCDEQIPICRSCVNGECVDNDVCNCYNGWNGTSCDEQIPICRSCVNGECVDNDVCRCYDGWNGTSCDEQIPICRSCVNGECVDNDVCNCYNGWNGSSCNEQIPVCRSCVNGECVDNDVCRCYDGWNGTSCDEQTQYVICDYCVNGVCITAATNTCKCFDGWIGSTCDKFQCDFCLNGQCNDENECICETGWKGTNCSTAETETVATSNLIKIIEMMIRIVGIPVVVSINICAFCLVPITIIVLKKKYKKNRVHVIKVKAAKPVEWGREFIP